jgi:hypothetical protein
MAKEEEWSFPLVVRTAQPNVLLGQILMLALTAARPAGCLSMLTELEAHRVEDQLTFS